MSKQDGLFALIPTGPKAHGFELGKDAPYEKLEPPYIPLGLAKVFNVPVLLFVLRRFLLPPLFLLLLCFLFL